MSAEKRKRRKVVASALGGWLQYLRKLTPYTQDGAAPHVGISAEGVKRIERGENVGIEFLLPYISWLEEELAVSHPERHRELKSGLFERLIEAGTRIRRTTSEGDNKPQLPDFRRYLRPPSSCNTAPVPPLIRMLRKVCAGYG